MNFHLGQNPLLPWSIDQAAVIYLPPGATAAISRGCHWLRLYHRQPQNVEGLLCSFCSKHRENWCSMKPYLHQLRLCSLGGLIGKLLINFFGARCLLGTLQFCFQNRWKLLSPKDLSWVPVIWKVLVFWEAFCAFFFFKPRGRKQIWDKGFNTP